MGREDRVEFDIYSYFILFCLFFVLVRKMFCWGDGTNIFNFGIVAGFPQRRTRFDLRPVKVEFVVEKLEAEDVLLLVFCFPFRYHSTNIPVLSSISKFLWAEGKKIDEIWSNSEKKCDLILEIALRMKSTFILSHYARSNTALQIKNTSKFSPKSLPLPHTQMSNFRLPASLTTQQSTLYPSYLHHRDERAEPKNLQSSKCSPFPLLQITAVATTCFFFLSSCCTVSF